MTDTAQKDAGFPRKLPTQLFFAGKFWNTFQHVAVDGVSLEHVSDPRYWQHVAATLKMFDVIEVLAADNSFEADLRVVNANKGALALRVIRYVGDPLLDEQPAERTALDADELFEVKFVPQDKWRVVDKATKEVIAKGFGTKEEAAAAVDNLLAQRKAA